MSGGLFVDAMVDDVHFKLLPGIVPMGDTLGSITDTELFPNIYAPF